MPFAPMTTTDSPQKRNLSGNKFVNAGVHSRTSPMNQNTPGDASSSAGPSKLPYSQRKSQEKEDEDYDRMFQLFDTKAEVEYLNSWEDDKFAASVYGDSKAVRSSSSKQASAAASASASASKPQTSGYDFGELLKDEPNTMGLNGSWRKY